LANLIYTVFWILPSAAIRHTSQPTPQQIKPSRAEEKSALPLSFIYFPYASPSVIFSVMLFVRPTSSTLLFYFQLNRFLSGKIKNQRAAPTHKQKDTPEKITQS
jgi:hypothetical protein